MALDLAHGPQYQSARRSARLVSSAVDDLDAVDAASVVTGAPRGTAPPPGRNAAAHVVGGSVAGLGGEPQLNGWGMCIRSVVRVTSKLPANPRTIWPTHTAAGARLPNHYAPPQTHQPAAPTKKACKCRPFRKRLKGFEPSTFCMASSTWGTSLGCNVPANRRFLTRLRAARVSGISRRFTGV